MGPYEQEQSRQPHTPQLPLPVKEQDARKLAPDQARKELRQAIQGSAEILASATTVLTLFPDTLVLDRTKLTLTKRRFFKTAEVMSIRIEDLLNITAEMDLFFGSIKIRGRAPGMQAPFSIGNFWRKEAIRLKRVTQGYIIAMQRNIDCNALPVYELAGMLDKLGEDDHDL